MSNLHNHQFTKTRIAPTPSGYLHVGNILSFSITAATAKRHGAKILLRIDDLDKLRASPDFIKDIFDTLNYLGVGWDEGPRNAVEFESKWSQQNRLNIYSQAINQLKTSGKLFACTCSRIAFADNKCTCKIKTLPFETPSANWRISLDKCRVQFRDYSGQIIDAELPAEIQDFIVRRKDGFPSYQLASLIDDLYFDIDLIVRGEDLWQSTLAQLCLAKELDNQQFLATVFLHHNLIKDASNKKLSKSAGSTSIKYLREHGRSAADILTEIAWLSGFQNRITDWEDFLEFIDKKFLIDKS